MDALTFLLSGDDLDPANKSDFARGRLPTRTYLSLLDTLSKVDPTLGEAAARIDDDVLDSLIGPPNRP